MTIEVYTRDGWAWAELEVFVVNHVQDLGGQRDYLLRPDDAGAMRFVEFDRGDPSATVDEAPTWRVPRQVAHDLHAALGRALGIGVSDSTSLRRDYDAERARVDKLADVVIAIATRTS